METVATASRNAHVAAGAFDQAAPYPGLEVAPVRIEFVDRRIRVGLFDDEIAAKAHELAGPCAELHFPDKIR
jgi:hypothetical protein